MRGNRTGAPASGLAAWLLLWGTGIQTLCRTCTAHWPTWSQSCMGIVALRHQGGNCRWRVGLLLIVSRPFFRNKVGVLVHPRIVHGITGCCCISRHHARCRNTRRWHGCRGARSLSTVRWHGWCLAPALLLYRPISHRGRLLRRHTRTPRVRQVRCLRGCRERGPAVGAAAQAHLLAAATTINERIHWRPDSPKGVRHLPERLRHEVGASPCVRGAPGVAAASQTCC